MATAEAMDVGTYAQLQQIQRARLARAKQRPASAPVEPKPRPLRPVNNDGAAGGAAYLPKHKDVATAGPRPKPAVPKNRAMPAPRVSRKKPVPSRVDFAKRPAGDEDEPSDFMRRFPEQMAQMERERASLAAASKARQEALDAAARADDASIERLLALERLPPGSRVAVPASDGYADRPAHGEVVHGHPPPPGYRVAPPGKTGLAERPHNSRLTMGEIQYLKLQLGAPTDEVRHREARRAQREREEPWRLGAQGAAARAAITSGSTVAMFDSGDPERAGVSGRHAVKHAASGRPYRRVVSDAFSL